MIGTLLLIIPTVFAISFFVLHKLRGNYYNDGYFVLGVISSLILSIITLFALGVYIETSSYEAQRNSIQSTLDYSRENNIGQYELATITRDVMSFNRKLETHQNFWYKHVPLWVNDDILEIEPIK